ncbi:MAG: hypothetical protein ACE5GE_16890 [Phycisphaerae bacterium]
MDKFRAATDRLEELRDAKRLHSWRIHFDCDYNSCQMGEFEVNPGKRILVDSEAGKYTLEIEVSMTRSIGNHFPVRIPIQKALNDLIDELQRLAQ